MKLTVAVAAAATVVIAALLIATRPVGPPQAAEPSSNVSVSVPAELLVRPDSHKLSTAADGKVTVVEFLDFECEACRAAYPAVERLREEYDGRVTFVMRYFPIPSHRNAELAARAVEAAGQQGQLERMYQKMYETQPQWGDQQVDHRETFLGFARELNLDMRAFEAALDAQSVAERVKADFRDGIGIGVQGTPTIFVNGGLVDGMVPTYETLKDAIERELARSPK